MFWTPTGVFFRWNLREFWKSNSACSFFAQKILCQKKGYLIFVMSKMIRTFGHMLITRKYPRAHLPWWCVKPGYHNNMATSGRGLDFFVDPNVRSGRAEWATSKTLWWRWWSRVCVPQHASPRKQKKVVNVEFITLHQKEKKVSCRIRLYLDSNGYRQVWYSTSHWPTNEVPPGVVPCITPLCWNLWQSSLWKSKFQKYSLWSPPYPVIPPLN